MPTATVTPATTAEAADEACWAAVLCRDRAADGRFVYAVRTTGVYCRPSCASRRPRRENVAFHPTPEAAERAGYRACRRCRPDEPSLAERRAAIVAEACRRIDAAVEPPSLEALAAGAGLAPRHFHRIFREATGVTPSAWAAGARARRVREALPLCRSVTEAMVEAGFRSTGRFYEASDAMLGMTPSAVRRGGAGATIRFAVGASTLGAILVAATERGVCAIALGDDPGALVRALEDRFSRAHLVGGDAAFERWVAAVVGFVEEPARGLDLPLDLRGTAFQHRVWEALRAIPVGATATYSEIAARLGAPGAARAVARACATNELALAIPCHRVVRTDGSLSGYRWGVERKRRLLEREARAHEPGAT